MSDLAKNIGGLTTFRILVRQDRNKLKSRLKLHARNQKPALIIPLLASEYTDPANLPVFERILNQLRQVTYLHKIIFGLDGATEREALILRDLLKGYEIRNYVIHWNDGPVFSEIYGMLTEAGFGLTEPGKGKNMFLGFGIALALGSHCVGLIDADIRSFDRVQLDRLLYPVVVLGYDFVKASYHRISDGRLYGRVKRLLLDPLLLSLKKKFIESEEEKMLGLVDFLLQYQYQLSGEVAFDSDLLRKMRFATNWGVEIFTLIEVYRKASSAAQVQFSEEPFNHKHQNVGQEGEPLGLNRMAVDIVTTLMNALIQEEGLEMSDTFFRDLSITYLAVAEEQIKKYSDEAGFNNLLYDRDEEEYLAKRVFRGSILQAGEILTMQTRITERFLRMIHTYPEFKPFLDAGLAETVLTVENRMQQSVFEIPQTVSWERVSNKLPNIFRVLKEAVKEENKRFV